MASFLASWKKLSGSLGLYFSPRRHGDTEGHGEGEKREAQSFLFPDQLPDGAKTACGAFSPFSSVSPCLRGKTTPLGSSKRTWFALATVAAILAACYLPDKFKAEVRVNDNGDYALSYYGDLIWAPLYRDIQRGTVPADEIPAKVEEIRQDLVRDKNFKVVQSLGQGRFHVEYQREGHLAGTDLVTFVRRNAIILQLHATPDGKVALDGAAIKPSDANEAVAMGLSLQGEFRLITDAQVLSHNANKVTLYQGYPVYIWTIENPFSPAPHLVMQRSGAWPTQQKAKP